MVSNRKVVNIYQGFMAKNLAKMAQKPMIFKAEMGEHKNETNKKMKLSVGSPEEKCNLNFTDEEKPNTVLNETPVKKKFNN
jgi:hypothetical protein